MSVRPATGADAAELARLRWEFRREHGTPEAMTFETFAVGFAAFVEDVLGGDAWRAWVAEADGRAVGCVWLQLVERVPHPNLRRWERPIAYVTSMYVAPDRRGRGLGGRLLDAAVTHARERGAALAILWPTERSIPFYERAGFAVPAVGGPLVLELEGD